MDGDADHRTASPVAHQPIALITGGRGDLATALRKHLLGSGFIVLHPGRDELDVRDSASVTKYFGKIRRIDLLINNAGLRKDRALPNLSEQDWDDVMATNLKGAFLCSASAAEIMSAAGTGGSILNIGSFSGKCGASGQANYAAAKAGLVGLTKSLAREFGPMNIRVNCVLPGWLETKFTAGIAPTIASAAKAVHVLGRLNTTEEAARAISFLAGLSHVSGQVFQLDSRLG